MALRAASRTAPKAGLAEQGAVPAAGSVARLRGAEVGVPAFAVWPAASGAAGWDGAADRAAPPGAAGDAGAGGAAGVDLDLGVVRAGRLGGLPG
jgi:hypothetical protein